MNTYTASSSDPVVPITPPAVTQQNCIKCSNTHTDFSPEGVCLSCRIQDNLFTESKEKRRVRHAEVIKKLEIDTFTSDWFKSKPQAVQELYRKMPPWKFYVYTDQKSMTDAMPIRHYGILEYTDDSLGYHAVTCHHGWSNEVSGGIKSSGLTMVDEWSNAQLEKIKLSNCPGAFWEPIGFLVFAPNS